jgi:hypothetical protein
VSYGPKIRRQRRRRSLIMWGLAALAIAIGIGVARAAGESELTRRYLDVAVDVVRSEQDTAEAFASMVENIEDFDRAALLSLLQQLEADTAVLVDDLDEVEPPEALVEGHLYLRIAITTWRSALSDSRTGLVGLSDDVLDEEAMATLTRGLVDLRVGDSAYAGFLSEVSGVDLSLHGGELPVVAFVPSDSEGLFAAQELARRLFLTEDIGPRSNVAISDLRLDPSSVGEQEGLAVLALTANQRAEVTVANRGNIPAAAINIQLTLISNDGLLWEARQQIEELDGGGLVTLVFSDLPVEAGKTYEIIATSLFPDDQDEDDTVSMLFLVNPEG